jgi:hypothetical protein
MGYKLELPLGLSKFVAVVVILPLNDREERRQLEH